MTGTRVGYARVSTTGQDLTAQRDALTNLGVTPDLIYVDHGLTGSNRDRPGLSQALAAVRKGDTLVVTKLDRLARSLPDARNIATSSPPKASPSTSAARSTTPPTLWAVCCSTCWAWLLSSRLT